MHEYPLRWPAWLGASVRTERTRSQTSMRTSFRDIIRLVQELGGVELRVTTNCTDEEWDKRSPRPNGAPAVAAWFRNPRSGKVFCVACDRWEDLTGNMRAIVRVLEAWVEIGKVTSQAVFNLVVNTFAEPGTGWGQNRNKPEPEPKPEPKPQPQTGPRMWYVVLGVSPSATPDDVDEAYRKLARKHHPDRGGDEATMKEINNAYDAYRKGCRR